MRSVIVRIYDSVIGDMVFSRPLLNMGDVKQGNKTETAIKSGSFDRGLRERCCWRENQLESCDISEKDVDGVFGGGIKRTEITNVDGQRLRVGR